MKSNKRGCQIGKTTSGGSVIANKRICDYNNFSSIDHFEASQIHRDETLKSTNSNLVDYHMQKDKLHLQASQTIKNRQCRRRKRLP